MPEATYVCLDCNAEFSEPHETCPKCGEEMSPDAKVPSNARYAAYQLRTDCGRCGQPMPLNGPQREVTCGACHNTCQVPPERWKSLLEDFIEEYDEFGWGDSRSSTVMTGGGTFQLLYGKQVPHCPHCHKVLPSFDLPVGADEVLTCRKCEGKVATFPAPDWLKAVLPSAVQLYGAEREAGEVPAQAVEAEGADAARPVVMQCPQCGGALKFTAESERLVPCEYCQVDVYLPDEVWSRLHPVKTSDRWMIRFEGPTRSGSAGAPEEKESFFEEDPDDGESSDPDGAPPPEPISEPKAGRSSQASLRGRSPLFWVLIVGAAAAGLVYLLLNWHA